MPVVFDAAASIGDNVPAGGGTLSWAHTTSGANRCLIVSITVRDALVLQSDTTVTYAGLAMTFVRSDTNINRVDVYQLTNPPVGLNDVVVTNNAPFDIAEVAGMSVSVTGTDQTTPIANQIGVTGNSTGPTATVTSAADRLIIGFVSSERNNSDAQITPGAGQTQQTTVSGPTLNRPRAETTTELGAGPNVVTSWTLAAVTNWIVSAIDIAASAGGGAADDVRSAVRSAASQWWNTSRRS